MTGQKESKTDMGVSSSADKKITDGAQRSPPPPTYAVLGRNWKVNQTLRKRTVHTPLIRPSPACQPKTQSTLAEDVAGPAQFTAPDAKPIAAVSQPPNVSTAAVVVVSLAVFLLGPPRKRLAGNIFGDDIN